MNAPTPRTDEVILNLNEEYPDGFPIATLQGHAMGLETELSMLTANLERLAERWEHDILMGEPTKQACMAGVRRVLSGETPPEAGKEWA